MIVGNLKNAERYYALNQDFEQVFKYLGTLAEDNLPEKIVMREGDVWVNGAAVFTDPANPDKDAEAHRKFLGIHYVISGEEVLGYAEISTLKTTKAYNEAGDCEMLTGQVQPVRLKAGDFCVVYPEDAHTPVMGKSEKLVKVVAKIRV